MTDFDKQFGGSATYIAYKKIEHKLTEEFQNLTLEIMIETYVRYEMLRPGLLADRDFVRLKDQWRAVADELRVLYDYPYNINIFPHAHPLTYKAAGEAKRRLGIL